MFIQNQCLGDPEIRKWLDLKRPEAIVLVRNTPQERLLWVIESKSKRTDIGLALDEAENYYAARLNRSLTDRVMFVSGVAGNDEESYVVKNRFLEQDIYKPVIVNERETSALLSPQLTDSILRATSATIADVPIDQAYFMEKADSIKRDIAQGGCQPARQGTGHGRPLACDA